MSLTGAGEYIPPMFQWPYPYSGFYAPPIYSDPVLFNTPIVNFSTTMFNTDRIMIKDEVMYRNPRLYFTIGLQRSGKSTFATKWAQKLSDLQHPYDFTPMVCDQYPRTIVCDDSVRLALHGDRYKHEAEDLVFTLSRYMIKALMERGHDVLHDETHTTERSIREVFKIDPEAQYFIIDTPKDVCIERAHATNQSDLVPVIERCHTQFENLKRYGIHRAIGEIREAVKAGNRERVLPSWSI